MGKKTTCISTLGGILLFGLLSFGLFACEGEKSNEGGEPNPPEKIEEPGEEATSEPVDPGLDELPLESQPLLLCRGNNLRVRKEPSQDAEVLTMLKRNDVAIYLGEESDHRDQITINGHTFDSPWLKIDIPEYSDGPGWIYGAFGRDNGLIEWLVRENTLQKQAAEGRTVGFLNAETQKNIEGMFNLEGLNYQDAKSYSGYYFMNERDALDGPFYICSSTKDDRDSRIVINGEHQDGALSQVILNKYDPPMSFEIQLTIEDGKCTGRSFKNFKGSKRIVKYTDPQCSLDESTVEYDL